MPKERICGYCGKVSYEMRLIGNQNYKGASKRFHEMIFNLVGTSVKNGQICRNCYRRFISLNKHFERVKNRSTSLAPSTISSRDLASGLSEQRTTRPATIGSQPQQQLLVTMPNMMSTQMFQPVMFPAPSTLSSGQPVPIMILPTGSSPVSTQPQTLLSTPGKNLQNATKSSTTQAPAVARPQASSTSSVQSKGKNTVLLTPSSANKTSSSVTTKLQEGMVLTTSSATKKSNKPQQIILLPPSASKESKTDTAKASGQPDQMVVLATLPTTGKSTQPKFITIPKSQLEKLTSKVQPGACVSNTMGIPVTTATLTPSKPEASGTKATTAMLTTATPEREAAGSKKCKTLITPSQEKSESKSIQSGSDSSFPQRTSSSQNKQSMKILPQTTTSPKSVVSTKIGLRRKKAYTTKTTKKAKERIQPKASATIISRIKSRYNKVSKDTFLNSLNLKTQSQAKSSDLKGAKNSVTGSKSSPFKVKIGKFQPLPDASKVSRSKKRVSDVPTQQPSQLKASSKSLAQLEVSKATSSSLGTGSAPDKAAGTRSVSSNVSTTMSKTGTSYLISPSTTDTTLSKSTNLVPTSQAERAADQIRLQSVYSSPGSTRVQPPVVLSSVSGVPTSQGNQSIVIPKVMPTWTQSLLTPVVIPAVSGTVNVQPQASTLSAGQLRKIFTKEVSVAPTTIKQDSVMSKGQTVASSSKTQCTVLQSSTSLLTGKKNAQPQESGTTTMQVNVISPSTASVAPTSQPQACILSKTGQKIATVSLVKPNSLQTSPKRAQPLAIKPKAVTAKTFTSQDPVKIALKRKITSEKLETSKKIKGKQPKENVKKEQNTTTESGKSKDIPDMEKLKEKENENNSSERVNITNQEPASVFLQGSGSQATQMNFAPLGFAFNNMFSGGSTTGQIQFAVPQTGQVQFAQVPQTGQVQFAQVPQTGQVQFAQVPQTGQIQFTQFPQTGQIQFASVPQTGQIQAESAPVQGFGSLGNQMNFPPPEFQNMSKGGIETGQIKKEPPDPTPVGVYKNKHNSYADILPKGLLDESAAPVDTNQRLTVEERRQINASLLMYCTPEEFADCCLEMPRVRKSIEEKLAKETCRNMKILGGINRGFVSILKNDVTPLKEYNWIELCDEFQSKLPFIFKMVLAASSKLTNTFEVPKPSDITDYLKVRLALIYSLIMQHRFKYLSSVQRMIAQFLRDERRLKKVTQTLAPLGICSSYTISLKCPFGKDDLRTKEHSYAETLDGESGSKGKVEVEKVLGSSSDKVMERKYNKIKFKRKSKAKSSIVKKQEHVEVKHEPVEDIIKNVGDEYENPKVTEQNFDDLKGNKWHVAMVTEGESPKLQHNKGNVVIITKKNLENILKNKKASSEESVEKDLSGEKEMVLEKLGDPSKSPLKKGKVVIITKKKFESLLAPKSAASDAVKEAVVSKQSDVLKGTDVAMETKVSKKTIGSSINNTVNAKESDVAKQTDVSMETDVSK